MNLNDVKYVQSEIAKENGQKGLFKMPEQIPTAIKRYRHTSKKITDVLKVKLRYLEAEKPGALIEKNKLKTQIKKEKTHLKKKCANLKAAAKFDPLKFFCPNGAQERIRDAIVSGLRNSRIPTILFTCGNGVGKTTLSVHVIGNIIFGPQSGWFDFDVFRNWDKPKLIWYISTADAIADTISPMIQEVWTSKFITERESATFKDGKKYISRIVTKDGWTILFKTYNQDPSKFEAAQVGIIVMDEPAPLPIWKAIKSRRRNGCLTLLPMTPLYCPPYIVDEVTKGVNQKKLGYYKVEASVYEASTDTINHGGVRGHLDPPTIEEMVDSYDEEEKQARIYGKLMYFSGSVYPEYSEELHVVDPEDWPIVARKYTIFQVTDPHDSRPCACLFAAVTPPDKYGMPRVIIYAETPDDDDGRKKSKQFWEYKQAPTLKQETERWTQIEEMFHAKADYRILDKRFGWQKRARTTFHKLFSKLGFNFIPSYDAPAGEGEILYGHTEVKRFLQKDENGIPYLLIHPSCRHVRAGFTYYIRRKLIGKASEDVAESDGVLVEKYKDFMDLVRYLIVGIITPVHMRGKSRVQILLDKVHRKAHIKAEYGSRYDDL